MSTSGTSVVQVQTTADDGAAFRQLVRKESGTRVGSVIVFAMAFYVFLGSYFFDAVTEALGILRENALMLLAAVGLLVFVPLWLLASSKYRQQLYDPKGLFLRPHELTIGAEGVEFRSDVAQLEYKWAALLRVVETPTHFFLYVDRFMAYIVPKRGFATHSEVNDFRAILRANIPSTTVIPS